MPQQPVIPVYVINLAKRTERKAHILEEFSGKREFHVSVVEAIEHEYGPLGLWKTIQHIIGTRLNGTEPYILLCEDDHQFTADYSVERLFQAIEQASGLDADVLCGGISWFGDGAQVSDCLFITKQFTGLQFTIIFRKFFDAIMNGPVEPNMPADFKISCLSDKKFFIHPFVSIQKEFGYSDVTPNNNTEGRVSSLFQFSMANVQGLRDVSAYYRKMNPGKNDDIALENITIPTYIINLPEREDRRTHIERQFAGKPEFDVTLFPAIKKTPGALGLWESIRGIVQQAIDNDDDVIIICEDDHEFTLHYSKEYLLKNIFEAHYQGAFILLGGVGHFGHALRLSDCRYWINHFWCTQFVVLFRNVFQRIMDEPYNEDVKADVILSEITSNKMVMYPFISIQQDFGYSDVQAQLAFNMPKLFETTEKRISDLNAMVAALPV